MKMAAGHKDVQVAYKWLNREPARCPAWIVDQEGVKRGLARIAGRTPDIGR